MTPSSRLRQRVRTVLALMAMTTSEVVQYVSLKDPAKVGKLVPIDPEKPDGDKHIIYEIGPNATVFHLAPLDVFLMGYVYDNASSLSGQAGGSEIGIKTRINQTNIDCVKYGLLKVDNFHIDSKGTNLTFKRIKSSIAGRMYMAVPDDVMSKFGVQLCTELADEIKKMSEVSGAEVKNSDAA